LDHSKKNSVLIVGAGSSGLTLGYFLSQKGFAITLLEKSNGLGGRIATRRWEDGKWDHGIPSFDRKDIPEAIWKLWSPVMTKSPNSSDLKYIAPLGLTQTAKLLAKDLTVHKKTRVVSFEFLKDSATWRVFDDSNKVFMSDFLVLTSPTPQTIDLLRASDLLEDSGMEKVLSTIRYRSHLVALAFIEAPSLQDLQETPRAPFELVVNNSGFITFYLNEAFSDSRWNQSDEVILNEIKDSLENLKIGPIKHLELKRWRYSNCLTPTALPFLSATEPLPLFAIGDSFSGGGLRGALTSALELSDCLLLKQGQHPKSS